MSGAGIWPQPVQISLSETSLQLTKVSPTVATALGGGHSGLGKGGDGDGHTEGCGLIAHSGAGLGVVQHLRIHSRKHWNLSFLTIAIDRLCSG